MPTDWYTCGVAVRSYVIDPFLAEAKTIDYLMAIMAQENAHAAGAVEAIYVSRETKHVLEGTTSNIVFIKDNRLIVPQKNILDGVSLKSLLNAAAPEFSIERCNVLQNEVAEMDEIIICSSNREVVPVVKYDDLTIGNGRPGKISCRLMELFRQETMENPEGL